MRNKIIFSVDQATASIAQNAAARNVAQAYLNRADIDYKTVKGAYKGKQEIAYIIDSRYAWLAQELATAFAQESLISVDAHGNAFLRAVDQTIIAEFGPLAPTGAFYDSWIEIDGKRMSFYPRESTMHSA